MTEFVFWKMAYDNSWATEADINSAIEFRLLTQKQGDMILEKGV